MTLHPKTPVGTFLRDAFRYPDGIVAYAIAVFSLCLLLAGWVLVPFLPELAFLQRAREDWLFLLLMPVASLAYYAWLNAAVRSTLGLRWRNVAALLFMAGVLLSRILFGVS